LPGALSHIRVCDFTGQLAGAGATRQLAALGAQVIRIEDPVNEGRWDVLRGNPPFKDERRGRELGGAFNNHNVGKLGVTLNVRTPRGKELLRKLVAVCDVVAENFAAGVLERWGFGYEVLKSIRPDIIYVSNCGFGHEGPYHGYKSWGSIVQAVSGLTSLAGLPDMQPSGFGYSYMDHTGGYYQALAILLALKHRSRTGEGQWVDMSCTESGACLLGPAILDYTVNGRPARRPGQPDCNHSAWPAMSPHGIFPALDPDTWVAIACRDQRDWEAFADAVAEPWTGEARFRSLDLRLANQAALDALVSAWTRERGHFAAQALLRARGVPASAVQSPEDRIDHDTDNTAWGLWPKVRHPEIGEVGVDGMPMHLSETDWSITRGAPCLGEHNQEVYGGLLGLDAGTLAELKREGTL
jgi:crotonobetainyl-CoA:carnitine CoA-transferase CaiB-like acyl-CoA transferase